MRETRTFHDKMSELRTRFGVPDDFETFEHPTAAALLVCLTEQGGMTPDRLPGFVARVMSYLPAGMTPFQHGMAVGLALAMITEPEERE